MILEALCRYYDILIKEDIPELPKYGYSIGRIDFALILSNNGELTGVMDLREKDGKRIFSKQMLIPEQLGRSGKNAPAYFLSDNAKYVLGIGDDKTFSAFNRFKKLHMDLLKDNNPLNKFLSNWNPSEEIKITIEKKHNEKTGKTKETIKYSYKNDFIEKYKEEFSNNPKLVFRKEGETGYIHEDPNILNTIYGYSADDKDDIKMQCLVTGDFESIARLHTPIAGIMGAHAAGGSIVSFNDDSFCSYGKTSSFNAPVSKIAMFKYTTILKYMLNNAKYHQVVGDTTTIFWAERTGIYENLLAELFNPSTVKNNEDVLEKDIRTRDLARDIIKRYSAGLNLRKDEYNIDPGTIMHILGISPNNARLSIAFYQVNTLDFFIKRLADHYSNMNIAGSTVPIPIWTILYETLPKAAKDKKISPVLSKNLMYSIFTGNQYPVSLFNAMISRIRADKDVNYKRVSVIKAYLMRKYQVFKNLEGLTVSLNESSTSIPYHLGRLFAVIEKAQKDAIGITTVRDRYFTSASATPASVFPVMMKLSLHHTAKAKHGGWLENQKGRILESIDCFPKQLSLDEQGEFILGYYHQNQELYKKIEKKGDVDNE